MAPLLLQHEMRIGRRIDESGSIFQAGDAATWETRAAMLL
jgi:hypothetical protein